MSRKANDATRIKHLRGALRTIVRYVERGGNELVLFAAARALSEDSRRAATQKQAAK